MKEEKSEFDKFDRTMDDLLRITPAEIKAKLEEEKKDREARNRGSVTPGRKRKASTLTPKSD